MDQLTGYTALKALMTTLFNSKIEGANHEIFLNKLVAELRGMNLKTDVTALVTGDASIKKIDTAALDAGTKITVTVSDMQYIYELIVGTDAEFAPYIIRPDDYDGDTNAKVFRLCENYHYNHVLDKLNDHSSTSLDHIPTTNLPRNFVIEFKYLGYNLRYALTNGTATEVAPFIILPEDYDADTNAVHWKCITPVVPFRVDLTWDDLYVLDPAQDIELIEAPGEGYIIDPIFVTGINHADGDYNYDHKAGIDIEYSGGATPLCTFAQAFIESTTQAISQQGVANKSLFENTAIVLHTDNADGIDLDMGSGSGSGSGSGWSPTGNTISFIILCHLIEL